MRAELWRCSIPALPGSSSSRGRSAAPARAGPGGLVGTMIGQQVSRASATAILGRLAALVDLDDPAAILAAEEDAMRAAGLSRAKERTLLGSPRPRPVRARSTSAGLRARRRRRDRRDSSACPASAPGRRSASFSSPPAMPTFPRRRSRAAGRRGPRARPPSGRKRAGRGTSRRRVGAASLDRRAALLGLLRRPRRRDAARRRP